MSVLVKETSKEKELLPLTGKVAIVTGGSRGIGAEIAKNLAENGAEVVINYNSSKDAAEQLINEIQEFGGNGIALQADVSKHEEAQEFIEKAKSHYGKIDILVNNAGITRDRTFKKMSKEDWDQVINVNLNSVYNTTSAVIDIMNEQKYGRIINISSFIGQEGGFGQTNYSASKAGIIGFTKSLALETAKNGITVNAVCPGYIATEMVKAIPEKVLQQLLAKIPMQRLGEPAEIADAVLFLAKNDYITGQTLNINGGIYM